VADSLGGRLGGGLLANTMRVRLRLAPPKIGGAAYFKALKKEVHPLCRNQQEKLKQCVMPSLLRLTL